MPSISTEIQTLEGSRFGTLRDGNERMGRGPLVCCYVKRVGSTWWLGTLLTMTVRPPYSTSAGLLPWYVTPALYVTWKCAFWVLKSLTTTWLQVTWALLPCPTSCALGA